MILNSNTNKIVERSRYYRPVTFTQYGSRWTSISPILSPVHMTTKTRRRRTNWDSSRFRIFVLIITVAYSMYLFISTYHFFCSSIKIFKWFNFVWFSKVITQGQHFKYCKIRMTMVPNIFNIPSPTHDRKK